MTRRRALTIIILLMLIGLLSALAGDLFGLVKLPDLITSHPLAALLLVGVTLGGLGFWLFVVESPTEKSKADSKYRQRMLKHLDQRITKLLADSLQGATRLELGLHEQPSAIVSFSPFSLQHLDQPTQSLPSQTSILQAYDHAEGQLLILGEPGAGKTTLLLELTRALLERAKQDASVPIPVIFNLASWAVKQQLLGNWLVGELANPSSYDVSRKLGQSWIDADEILPLLDGLDEVPEGQRSACVEAINAYRQKRGSLLPIVICSRKADYFNQPSRLHLQSAVVVEPLSPQQIKALLSSAGRQMAGLRRALASDPSLRELAPIPLMLNLMMLAYQGLPAKQIMSPSSLSTRQQQVLADYVQRRLQRRGPGARYTSEQELRSRYTREQTLRWLGWLAGQMTLHNQADFYLERMQPDWLPNSSSHRQYQRLVKRGGWLVSGLLIGLIMGLIFGMGGWLFYGLGYGLLFGLGGGLLFGLGGGLTTAALLSPAIKITKTKIEGWLGFERFSIIADAAWS